MKTTQYHSIFVEPYYNYPSDVNLLIVNTNCTVTLYKQDSDCLFFLDTSYYVVKGSIPIHSPQSLKLSISQPPQTLKLIYQL